MLLYATTTFVVALHKIKLISTSGNDCGNKKIARNVCGRVSYIGQFFVQVLSQQISRQVGWKTKAYNIELLNLFLLLQIVLTNPVFWSARFVLKTTRDNVKLFDLAQVLSLLRSLVLACPFSYHPLVVKVLRLDQCNRGLAWFDGSLLCSQRFFLDYSGLQFAPETFDFIASLS